MYVIKRTDQGGGYVAPAGSKHSYTKNLSRAQQFATVEEAKASICPENEIVVPLNEIRS